MDADAQRQEKLAQLRYRKLVDNLPGCIVFVLDQNLRVTYAGGGLVTHAGFRPQNYLGRLAGEFAPPSMYECAEQYLLSTFGGEETNFELDYPAGPSFEVRTTPLQDDREPASEILVIALDTTKRKRAEAAERATQGVLQQAAQAANVGLWICDTQAGRVQFSHEWKQQLGYADDEIYDSFEEWECRLHPDDRERACAMAVAYLAAPWPTYEQEFRLRHKDGSYHWILARGAVYDDAEGKPARIFGVHIDITERKLSEIEREQMREQMREQLAWQERLSAVGQLAAGIAHDFNNILSTISIYAEMLRDAPDLPDRARARTQMIVEQVQRATRLVRQILDFSRQSVFDRHPLDLLPLLKEEVRLLRQTLPESIEVRLEYVHGEYVVEADPGRMQQLVMNLAVNARDAMPEGGTLGIALTHRAALPKGIPPVPGMAPETWVEIVVSDTGTGIPPEHLAHIFEPFFTTKEPGKGTGLGLAQAHGIVAQHGGQVAVASEPGVGTIFAIYLPAATLPQRAAAPPPTQVLPQGQREYVLLVEDDDAVRGSLAALLEGWNYRVVEAANGQEALTCLAQRLRTIDVILSDVVMPRLGGIGLVKALRRDGVETPVILMSGHMEGEARVALREAGVVAWLDKPLSPWLLAKALVEAVATSGRQAIG